MTYELAKKLKDAGFPQTMNGIFCHEDSYYGCYGFGLGKDDEVHANGEGWTGCDETDCPKLAKCPTLSELIEACGKDFESLTLVNKWWTNRRGNWPDGEKCYRGDTAEEAVANLWLAIHKK